MARRSLYKYFSKQPYAEDFLDGIIYFRSLTYFRDYDDKNVREDKNEGTALYSPAGGLHINNMTQGKSMLAPEWSFSSSAKQKDIFVFCLSQSFSRVLWDKFGAVACVEIRDIGEFCRRAEAALPPKATFPKPHGRARIGHRVEYYKATEAGSARWALPDRISTSKLSDYAWQDEFRLVFSVADAFEFENVDTRLVHVAHQDVPNHAEHFSHQAKARSLRDICRLHSAMGH